MTDLDPKRTFRGLPLTPEQNNEIRHYIKTCRHQGKPWDTPELAAMLHDMLEPPGNEASDSDMGADVENARGAAERAQFSIEDEMDPTEAAEEWQAAIESEVMKRLNH